MKAKKIVFNTLLLFALISCKQSPSELPKSFSSYNEAVSKVKNTYFDVEETINTKDRSKDNWVTSAAYKGGFLIIGMKGKEYIFDEVPESVWNDFKNSDDLGKFYNQNIKNKFPLTLKGQSSTDTQCNGITKKGKRCKRNATKNGFCFQHG